MGSRASGLEAAHLKVDAETGQIVASVLTGKAINDGVMVGRLLD
jgi:hypothetical protein